VRVELLSEKLVAFRDFGGEPTEKELHSLLSTLPAYIVFGAVPGSLKNS
jgi:hypothetical protein